jgi:phosphoserine aminotransferase
VAVVEVQQVQQVQVAQVQQEQSLSTGDLPNPNDLDYKMYAIIENGVVRGYQWDNNPVEGLEFVLMTFDNSPAYTGGRYENGRFTEG